MSNDINDYPEFKRAFESAFAIQCQPILDEILATVRRMNEERRQINEDLRDSFEKAKGAERALRNLLATQIQETSAQDPSSKPPTRSIQ